MRVVQYYSRWRDFRGGVAGLPGWARAIVMLFAIPGIVLAVLSIAALGVSILALLLLALPVYQVMDLLVGHRHEPADENVMESMRTSGSAMDMSVDVAPRRHVEVKVLE